jgi:probable HAF family extracellular repeat protein
MGLFDIPAYKDAAVARCRACPSVGGPAHHRFAGMRRGEDEVPPKRSVVTRVGAGARGVWVGLAFFAALCAQAQTYLITDLGTLGGSFSMALGINARGQIVGNSFTAGDQALHGFIFSNGKMQDLGTLGGTSSYVDAIDDHGQVFGTTYTTGNALLRAFVYANGKMTDLGPLDAASSRTHSVNAADDVAGSAYIGGSASLHAYLYRVGSMQDLGTLGGASSFAYGINDGGQVVGSSNVAGDDGAHAFVYRDGAMQDLNDLAKAAEVGWTLNSARAINAFGQIVGFGAHKGETAAFLLTPVSSAKTVPKRNRASLCATALKQPHW